MQPPRSKKKTVKFSEVISYREPSVVDSTNDEASITNHVTETTVTDLPSGEMELSSVVVTVENGSGSSETSLQLEPIESIESIHSSQDCNFSPAENETTRQRTGLSEEEYIKSFYTASEVTQMRINASASAIDYARKMRLFVDPDKLTKAKAEARGLESSSYERDRHRSICIEAVVAGQHFVKELNKKTRKERDKLIEDEYLARVSSKCSLWAKELAREDGEFDYMEAYGEEEWFVKPNGKHNSNRSMSSSDGTNKKPLPHSIALEKKPFPYENYYDAVLDASIVPKPVDESCCSWLFGKPATTTTTTITVKKNGSIQNKR